MVQGVAVPGQPNGDKAKRVELIIAQLDSLPTLPAVAARLLQITSDSKTSAKQVIELVQSDPSLTAKILSLVRRAHSGVHAQAVTIDKAVVLMGFDAVRNAVLSIKVFEAFGPHMQEEATSFDRPEFWKHSLAVACASRLIARELGGGIDAEEAFVCGLLHDLGKVALDTCLPKSFDRVVRTAENQRTCITDVERRLLDIDHTVVGRRLGERWSLPDSIVQCMWLHHNGPEALPEGISQGPLIRLVHLADMIVRHQRIGYSGTWVGDENPPLLAESIGLGKEQYDNVIRALPDELERRASIIGLEALSSKELYARALADANEELSRVNASLKASNRRLQTRSHYFQALSYLAENLSPHDPIARVCIHAGHCAAQAMKAEAVLAFARQAEAGYVEVALVHSAEELEQTEVISPQNDPLLTGELDEVTVESTLGGAWIIPAAPQAQALVDRYASQLGTGPYWLLPIVRDRHWVGGVVFSASARLVAARRSETEELASLSSAVGLMMTNVLIRQAAARLSEDLAEANRRLQQVQAQLLRTRSLSMIAEMAAGAAHELNNPLAVITGRAQLLRDRAEDEENRRVLTLISDEAHRCSSIVSELMDFARPPSAKPQAVPLATLLQRVRASWASKTWLTEDRFTLGLSDVGPTVWADPAQLEQVLDEVIQNAVQAMSEETGRLSINCRADQSDERVVLTVEDNGRGMSPEVLSKAFDPFFSHRPAGRYRGLGLARAARLIEANHGRLRLESTPDQGTTAILELPIYDASHEAPSPATSMHQTT